MIKKIIFSLLTLAFVFSCDDGDFDVPNFVFSTDVDYCGNLVLHNINADKSEALIINLAESNENSAFFKTAMDDETFNLVNQISYRVFNGDVSATYFCQDIPPVSPSIREQWIGNAELIVNNSIIFDDNDGILSSLENGGIDPYTDDDGDSVFHYLDDDDQDDTIGDDDNSPQLDTDGDNIPNFYDLDDDNDGIKTENELFAFGQTLADLVDADGDNVLDYLDTDGDGIFNYLDSDDDDDGTPTLLESNINDTSDNGIKDYLDPDYSTAQAPRGQITNKYTLSYSTTFILNNMSLKNNNGNAINYENYEYGATSGSVIIE